MKSVMRPVHLLLGLTVAVVTPSRTTSALVLSRRHRAGQIESKGVDEVQNAPEVSSESDVETKGMALTALGTYLATPTGDDLQLSRIEALGNMLIASKSILHEDSRELYLRARVNYCIALLQKYAKGLDYSLYSTDNFENFFQNAYHFDFVEKEDPWSWRISEFALAGKEIDGWHFLVETDQIMGLEKIHKMTMSSSWTQKETDSLADALMDLAMVKDLTFWEHRSRGTDNVGVVRSHVLSLLERVSTEKLNSMADKLVALLTVSTNEAPISSRISLRYGNTTKVLKLIQRLSKDKIESMFSELVSKFNEGANRASSTRNHRAGVKSDNRELSRTALELMQGVSTETLAQNRNAVIYYCITVLYSSLQRKVEYSTHRYKKRYDEGGLHVPALDILKRIPGDRWALTDMSALRTAVVPVLVEITLLDVDTKERIAALELLRSLPIGSMTPSENIGNGAHRKLKSILRNEDDADLIDEVVKTLATHCQDTVRNSSREALDETMLMLSDGDEYKRRLARIIRMAIDMYPMEHTAHIQ